MKLPIQFLIKIIFVSNIPLDMPGTLELVPRGRYIKWQREGNIRNLVYGRVIRPEAVEDLGEIIPHTRSKVLYTLQDPG